MPTLRVPLECNEPETFVRTLVLFQSLLHADGLTALRRV
jgi:hypothetical protein